MTKFDQALVTYKQFLTEKLAIDANESVLYALTKMLGPSIYDADASVVACSDKDEVKHVKTKFLIEKLGLADTPELDTAVKYVCKQMGTTNRKKYRAVFYYLLLQYFDLMAQFETEADSTEPTFVPPYNLNDVALFYKTYLEETLQYPFVDFNLVYKLTQTVNSIDENGKLMVVDTQNAEEADNLKYNFLLGRLGVDYDASFEEAFDTVNKRMGDLPKYRIPFYYLLTSHFGKEWVIMQPADGVLY